VSWYGPVPAPGDLLADVPNVDRACIYGSWAARLAAGENHRRTGARQPAYYDNNDLSEEMEAAAWTRHDGIPAAQQSVSVSVRLSGPVLQALRARAEARGVGYTALIRELVEAGLARQDEQVPVSVILAAVAEYQQRKAS
jgi:predicted DNA binding CopG/RHH family protein